MAHELTQTNSIFEFAFNPLHGQPWHTLGQEMTADATIDEWRTSAGSQFASAQWGQGAALKERAFQDLLAMA